MRVLLVDPSSRGGIANYTAMIARALLAAGVKCTLLGSCDLEEVPAGVPTLRRLPTEPWGKPAGAGAGFYLGRASTWIRSAAVIISTVRAKQADVIHFQAPINRRFDALLVRWLARRWTVVWTAHDVLPFETTDADRARFAAIYRAVSQVIVHTDPAAQQVRELAGVDAAVIDHPVPDDFVRVLAAQAREQLGLPVEGRLFCALGFIRAYKGYGLLADVWERLGTRAPRLLVMGQLLAEEERPVLERLCQSPQVELRLGYASERDLRLAASAADALLLPYSIASDSGLVHLARAAGVPVIASDAPQLAASVNASGSGIVLERDVAQWADAVTGELPPKPPAPPSLQAVGREHRVVYEAARAAPNPRRRFRLVVYTDATELGGAERVASDLLVELDPEIDVIVMGVDAYIVEWIARGRPSAGTCVVPPVRDKRDLRPMLAHWRALLALRPDIFQAGLRHPWSCQYGIAAALLTPGTKVIAVEHALTDPTARIQLRLKKLMSTRLDAHVAVGSRRARELERLIGLRPGSIRAIYNGVQAIAATPARHRGSRPTVGAIGRLSPEKGFDVLLRALVALPVVEAVIVGEGPERGRLERLRDELGVADRTSLHGWAPDVSDARASFDVLVLPSRSESLPLVVLDAMHAGLPVVASDVGSVSEAVIDGETGVLVPPDDELALAAAIRTVLDPATAKRMGARAREVARSYFTRERMTREYEQLYRELLA